jgi:beta-lactam-binding protein with PASTA domain
VTKIVMPNIVGLSDDEAGRVLVASGIVSVDEHAPDGGAHSNGQSRVVAQSPGAGKILFPPNIRVTVTVR